MASYELCRSPFFVLMITCIEGLIEFDVRSECNVNFVLGMTILLALKWAVMFF